MVALGVEYDRTGLWVFVVPAASACAVMAASWAVHTRNSRACYPPRRYWLAGLLPGALLATVGKSTTLLVTGGKSTTLLVTVGKSTTLLVTVGKSATLLMQQ